MGWKAGGIPGNPGEGGNGSVGKGGSGKGNRKTGGGGGGVSRGMIGVGRRPPDGGVGRRGGRPPDGGCNGLGRSGAGCNGFGGRGIPPKVGCGDGNIGGICGVGKKVFSSVIVGLEPDDILLLFLDFFTFVCLIEFCAKFPEIFEIVFSVIGGVGRSGCRGCITMGTVGGRSGCRISGRVGF